MALIAPQDGMAFWGVTRDISPRGLFVSTSRNLAIGSVLKVEVVPERGQELQVVARVVRSRDNGFACEFVDQPKALPSRLKKRHRAVTRRYSPGTEHSLVLDCVVWRPDQPT